MNFKKFQNIRNNRGFTTTIVLIIFGIILLSYLGVDLQNSSASPIIKKNFTYVIGQAKNLWTNFLREPTLASVHIFKEWFLALASMPKN